LDGKDSENTCIKAPASVGAANTQKKSSVSQKKIDKVPAKSVTESKISGIDLSAVAITSSVDSQDNGESTIIIDEIDNALISRAPNQIYRIVNESRGAVGKIQTASTLWCRAAGLGLLDFWRDPISSYVCALVKEQLVEEDLFTDSNTMDLAAIIVELLGYLVVSTPSSFKLKQLQSPASFPIDFLRLVLQVEPGATVEAVGNIFSCFNGIRLDRFLSDYLDDVTLRSLSDSDGFQHGRHDNRSIAVALTVVFEFESARAAFRMENAMMEQRSALTPILGISPLVRSSLNSVVEQQEYFRDSLFANLPTFAAVTSLWCPNKNVETQQLQFVRSNLNILQELTAKIFHRCLKVHRESVVNWVSRLTYLVHQQMHSVGRHRLMETKDSEPWHSGFILNLAAVLLVEMRPLFSDPTKFLSLIDVEYVSMAAVENLMKGGPNMADGRILGLQRDETTSDIATDVPPASSSQLPGQKKEFTGKNSSHSKKHNFPSEIFWLTSTAMELVEKIGIIQEEFVQQTLTQFNAAKERYEAGGRTDRAMEVGLSHLRQCVHGFYYGWQSSPLCDPHFLSLSCSWAHFAASYVRLQMNSLHHDSDEVVARRLQCIPAWLLKAICSVWNRAALGSLEYRMTGEMVSDAALFCLDLMRCQQMSNIIVQDRLVDVLYAFVATGEAAGGTKSGESMYFGPSRRGYAAEVMDSQRMRNELCPALMDLYSSCHAVAALDANEDVQFDKFNLRVHIGKLLKHLYKHPLPEPRQSILSYVAAGDGFEAFLLSAIDTITFTTYEALRNINFDRRNSVGMIHPQAGDLKRRCLSTFGHSKLTFDMMNLFCEGEEQVRLYIHGRPELLQKVASFLFTFFSRLFTTEVFESFSTESRYAEWGLKAKSLVPPPVTFLMSCMGVGNDGQESLASLITSAPDFDLQVFERVSKLAEGAALVPFVDLSRTMIQRHVKAPDPREGLSIDWNALIGDPRLDEELYQRSMESIEQVAPTGGFAGGHHFQRLHASSPLKSAVGNNVKMIMKDYAKTKRMLPRPSIASAVWMRYDGSHPSYCRAVMTGPAHTPYFGGVFTFDVYFPPDYPLVPPLIQFLTTAGGTERFHYHLYADGKVCLSLLGNTEGSDTDRWNPATSSLGQVLVSVQTLFFGEHQFHSGGVPYPGMSGQKMSGDEYFEFRIATVRHAMVSVLKHGRALSTQAAEGNSRDDDDDGDMTELHSSVVTTHFKSCRRRLFQSLREEIGLLKDFPLLFTRFSKEVHHLIQEMQFLDC